MPQNSIPKDWPEFYKAIASRQPRPLLIKLLEMIAAKPTASAGQAIDVGCGDGIDTFALLNAGWRVLAIDGEPQALSLVEANAQPEARSRLQVQRALFHEM